MKSIFVIVQFACFGVYFFLLLKMEFFANDIW